MDGSEERGMEVRREGRKDGSEEGRNRKKNDKKRINHSKNTEIASKKLNQPWYS